MNGVHYDLGSETGLEHSYIDRDVINGQTYYYAVVSYDRGFLDTTVVGEVDGFAPSECTSIVQVDINGNVRTDVNTAVAVPRAPAAGYLPAGVEGSILHSGPGSGSISVTVIDPDSLLDGNTYNLEFKNDAPFQNNPVPTASMINVGDGRVLVEDQPVVEWSEELVIADGMIVNVFNDSAVTIVRGETVWEEGGTNTIPTVELDEGFLTVNIPYPSDFELRFSGSIIDTSTSGLFFGGPPAQPVNFTIWNHTEDRKMQFLFYDTDSDARFTPGDRIVTVHGDSLGKPAVQGNYRATWAVQIEEDTSQSSMILPGDGDLLSIVTTKPFRTGEQFQFQIRTAEQDPLRASQELDRIAVVPNPYVGAASWEPPNPYKAGRGTRLVYFVNLPAVCTIRIFTVRGALVQTLYHSSTIADGQEP
ncbi:MAG: hypothetical protein KAJ12_03355, partial [Bacteroidetes bacterium]|nr:hypothetical protein [Bacteroidota bacterium]